MFCGKCGNNLPDGATFCGFCGAELTPVKPQVKMPDMNNVMNNVKSNVLNIVSKVNEEINKEPELSPELMECAKDNPVAAALIEKKKKSAKTQKLLIIGGAGVAVIIILSILISVITAPARLKKKLIGDWVMDPMYDQLEEYEEIYDSEMWQEFLEDNYSLEINSNGEGELCNEDIEWELDGKILTIDPEDGDEQEFKIKISGDTLRMYDEDSGELLLRFNRK